MLRLAVFLGLAQVTLASQVPLAREEGKLPRSEASREDSLLSWVWEWQVSRVAVEEGGRVEGRRS